jgi:hypothetical protein
MWYITEYRVPSYRLSNPTLFAPKILQQATRIKSEQPTVESLREPAEMRSVIEKTEHTFIVR